MDVLLVVLLVLIVCGGGYTTYRGYSGPAAAPHPANLLWLLLIAFVLYALFVHRAP